MSCTYFGLVLTWKQQYVVYLVRNVIPDRNRTAGTFLFPVLLDNRKFDIRSADVKAVSTRSERSVTKELTSFDDMDYRYFKSYGSYI